MPTGTWIAGAFALVGAVLGIGCAAPPADDADASDSALAESAAAEPMPRDTIPEPQAFLGWSDNDSLVSLPRPQDAKRIEVACADKRLFPTHPAADRKTYHRAAYGRYDHFKLDGDSSVCLVKGTTKDAAGKLRCLSPDSIQYDVLSDTFEDACGNFYRGFWEVSFLTHDETMGTLMSVGRAFYDVPNSQFKGEVYDAQTRPVSPAELLFVSPLHDGDAAAIAAGKQRVLDAKTHRYDPQTHVFEYIGPYR